MEQLKENIACYNCGSNQNSLRYSHDGWNVVNCNNCGFVFTNPRPTLDSLPGFYAQSYFDSDRFNHSGEGKFPARLSDIYKFKQAGSLLEIGCAQGHFLNYMNRLGWDVNGVEISEDACRLISEKFSWPVFNGDFLDFPSTKKYDVICMYHVLEHVPEPLKVINKAKELLKPDGILVVEVPNIEGYDMKNPDRKKGTYDLPIHLTHYTPKLLSKLLKRSGFKILTTDLYHPQFVLDYFESKKSKKNNIGQQPKTSEYSFKQPVNQSLNVNKELPKKSLKVKLVEGVLAIVAKFYPGWRFTIIARK
jgi:SAM-dependent methyltransferase